MLPASFYIAVQNGPAKLTLLLFDYYEESIKCVNLCIECFLRGCSPVKTKFRAKVADTDSLHQKLEQLQIENENLKKENRYLKSIMDKHEPLCFHRTGWEDIDALFEQVERNHEELRKIRIECSDLLY
jgi:hypothetical protein